MRQPRFFSPRIVAFILLPSLVADPAVVHAFATPRAVSAQTVRFQSDAVLNQAILARDVYAFRGRLESSAHLPVLQRLGQFTRSASRVWGARPPMEPALEVLEQLVGRRAALTDDVYLANTSPMKISIALIVVGTRMGRTV